MTEADAFLESLGKLTRQRQGDRRAPHKPLLLLWALGRVRTRQRLVPYQELEPSLRELLRQFGRPRGQQHPEDPYWRLRKDGLWQIPEAASVTEDRQGHPNIGLLRQTSGGLPEPLYQRLRDDPELVWKAAQWLLDEQWPETRHDEIRASVGLARPAVVQDSASEMPTFVPDVLQAYEDRCAVCDYDVRIGDRLVGIEAAHIKWPKFGGPDEVRNGLALCSFHHKALDMGAIGLEPQGRDVVILVSDELRGMSQAFDQQLIGFIGRPLRAPQRRSFAPAADYLAWHREEVFQGEPRESRA